MASTPNDPFAKPVLIAGLLLLATAVFVLASNLFSTIQRNSTVGSDDPAAITDAVHNNLAPIGTVVAVDKTVAPVARSGEEIYNAVCSACHATGVLEAPKLEKAAWTERAAKGLEGLLNSAINGLNQMPARGGDPSLTDEEMKSALLYMTDEAGLEFGEGGGETVADAEEKAAEETPAQETAAQETPAQETPAQTATQQATQPTEAVAVVVPAETVAVVVPVQETAQAPAQETEAPAQQATQQQATQQQAPAAETTPAATQTASAANSDINGEKVYRSICFSCHDSGVAGSPKPSDKAAWETRLQAGMDTLYASVINGKGAMPPKGGNPTLSDDEIRAAVDWMLAQSQ